MSDLNFKSLIEFVTSFPRASLAPACQSQRAPRTGRKAD